jgi:hypothetical protein
MQEIKDFLLVKRPPQADVGWEGGFRADRDTTGISGGSFANTAHTGMVWNRIGKGIKNREFSMMVLTESFQDEGEAVSDYLKTVKRGKAPCWGACFEVCDDGVMQDGPMVGLELDMFCTGPATDPTGPLNLNGGRVRVGIDMVLRDDSRNPASKTEGSIAYHSYANADTPWARWIFGAWFRDYTRSGLRLTGNPLNGWVPERAIDIQGEHVVGIDFSQGKFQSVFRLKEGQAITLDEYDNMRILRKNNAMVLQVMTLVNGEYTPKEVFSVGVDGVVRAKKFVEVV